MELILALTVIESNAVLTDSPLGVCSAGSSWSRETENGQTDRQLHIQGRYMETCADGSADGKQSYTGLAVAFGKWCRFSVLVEGNA